jgi:hypothetical protein
MSRTDHERPRTVPASPAPRDTPTTQDDTPVLPGISPDDPGSMPRAEDDAETYAHSPEFHDRPGSGRHTDERLKHF